MNEIVFHNNVSMDFCCGIIEKEKDKDGFFKKIKLPRQDNCTMKVTKTPLDYKPFLCFPFHKSYTGIDPLPENSLKFLKIIAHMCNINSLNKSYDQIYDILLKESKKINENRELQDIKILQNFRNKKKGGKNKKRFTKKIRKSKPDVKSKRRKKIKR